jgi:hypothetical protein
MIFPCDHPDIGVSCNFTCKRDCRQTSACRDVRLDPHDTFDTNPAIRLSESSYRSSLIYLSQTETLITKVLRKMRCDEVYFNAKAKCS